VANVHGELVVCVSLARLLGLASPATEEDHTHQSEHSRILVIQHQDVRAVCPVDRVHGIHHFHPRQLLDVPATVGKSSTTFTAKILPWEGHSVGVLSEQLLFVALKRSFA
jgi:chemotaxis-related protein WspD